jgi:hypothetical protein
MADYDNRLQHDTPKRARVRGAIEYMEARNIPHDKEDVFRYNGVGHRQGWAMISKGSVDRRHHNREDVDKDHRGRPSIIGHKEIREMDRIIREEGFEARCLSWEALGREVGLDCSRRTIQRAMGSMSYHKCIACTKAWCNNSTAKHRVEWSTVTKERYPEPEDWKPVRFSDEVHWSLGPQGKMRIIRKPGERYCADCIQQQDNKEDEKLLKRLHSWAAVGYDFKSDLHFYDVASNTNGKMTQRDYINQILEPIVKPWLKGPRFVLEEDGDSGHGPGKHNIVRT